MAPTFKLYYSKTTCGAANYIVAAMSGLDFEAEEVNIYTKVTASGNDFKVINPKGSVPCIVFPDEKRAILNESVATLTWIADQNKDVCLAPCPLSSRRYEYLNALGFVNSELHIRIGGLFNKMLTEETKSSMRKMAMVTLGRFVDLVLAGKPFCLDGDKPTAADIYAYIALTWCPHVGLNSAEIPAISKYMDRVVAVPEVKKAIERMNAEK